MSAAATTGSLMCLTFRAMARPGTAWRPRMRLGILATFATFFALALPAGASAAVPASFFGMSALLPTSHDLEKMHQGGIGTYRIGIDWRSVQHTRKGGFNWSSVDADFTQTINAGLKPAPFLYGSPRFISRSPSKIIPPTSAEDLDLWGKFVAAATKRYGPAGDYFAENPYAKLLPVHQWIIWNEQNARAFWFPRADPRAYARLVKVSDRAISSVDDTARVSLGGMFAYPHDGRSMVVKKFLRTFYRVRGIENHFDIVDLHPYGAGIGTVRKQIKQARSVMRKADDGDASILIGELGWASGGPKKIPSVVGVAGQRNRIRDGLKLLIAKRHKWNISGVYVYVWRDFSVATPCLWCPRAGMLTEDGDAKPAWIALKKTIRDNR